MSQDLALSLTDLLRSTARAHRAAFKGTSGDDPGWATWYAAFMHHTVETLVGRAVPTEQLTELLRRAEASSGRHPEEDPASWLGGYLARALS